MDYYTILGVPRTATHEEIRKAYKKQSMKHHPDRGGNHDEFVKVQQAYEVLSNSDKRSAYDNPQPGFSFNNQGGNPFAGSPFEHMFRNQGFQQSRTPRNRDITLGASISLKDVLVGKNLIMQYRLSSGKLETATVDIPPGARTGDTIRFQELGDDGNPRFPRGDLHVRLKVQKQKNWERDENNLITRKVVNIFDLLLGCAIIVETLDNKQVKITIPKGTKPGQIFSVNSYGIPDINTRRRGNLYVNIEAHIPVINNQDTLDDILKIKNSIK